jgi:hypothetical protein
LRWVISDGVRFTPADVVDNVDSGFSVIGNWGTSIGASGFFVTDYRYNEAGTGADIATWEAELLDGAGLYEVFVWYPANSLYASNAPFTIRHSGLSDTVLVDQKINGGQWVSLGTYNFANSGVENISLSDNANGWVVADAVRFVSISVLPEITDVTASNITSTSALITWTTDQAADSLVEYGTTSGNYLNSEYDSAMLTSHSISLTGLIPSTTYYYIVTSSNANGTATSIEYTFSTTSASFVIGDLDGDGEVRINDALGYLRFVVNLDVNNVNPICDVTCDQAIRVDDALLVLEKVVDPQVNLECPLLWCIE